MKPINDFGPLECSNPFLPQVDNNWLQKMKAAILELGVSKALPQGNFL